MMPSCIHVTAMKTFRKVLAAACAAMLLAGCNRTLIDTTWAFDRAIVTLPDGTIVEGEVSTWKDFEQSDMIQVTIDGTTYLTHSANVVLIEGE